jgi:ABC-type uncharacterized transport system
MNPDRQKRHQMKLSLRHRITPATTWRPAEQARAQTALLVAIVFLLGVAVSALVFYATSRSSPNAGTGTTNGVAAVQLSQSTLAVLHRLNAPLEIHSYALLDTATVPASLTAFAGRVDRLLAAYEQAGNGLVKLTRFDALSTANTDAAEADHIQPFNREKGDTCYLGLALLLKGQKETLPRLSPDWEQALEPDLTRAIEHLVNATQPPPTPAAASPLVTNAAQQVRALIPDVNAVSLEEGKKILQAAALKDFTAAAKEMQAQRKEAEDRLSQAQASGSEADKQAAKDTLQRLQAEQAEKLKQIADRSKAQVDAFQQLKSAAR